MLTALALLLPTNYAPNSDAWNGLNYLEITAQEAKVDLKMTDRLDWDLVRPSKPLIFLAPGDRDNAFNVMDYVLDGGHAVVALEPGSRSPIARLFGVRHVTPPLIHDSYYRDHPAFPQLQAEGEHFLWYNVDQIVLNHPTALTVDPAIRGAVQRHIGFAEPNQSFALEVHRGAGSILFLSDASVFINDMQRLSYGDKQLAANVFRYFCGGDSCEVLVVPPWATETGEYQAEVGGLGGIEQIFARAVEELNALAAPANESLSNRTGVVALALGLLFALSLGAAALLVLGPLPHLSWVRRARRRTPHTELWAHALADSKTQADFTLAAAALGQRTIRRVRELLPKNARVHAGRKALAQEIGARCGDEHAARAARCFERFDASQKAGASGPHPMTVTALSEFEQLWNDSEQVIKALRQSNNARG
jgi:hypothetical protein